MAEDQKDQTPSSLPSSNELPEITDDPQTDKIIEDIEKHETDEVLALQDIRGTLPATSKGWRQRLRTWLSNWWDNKWARYGTLTGLLAIVLLVLLVQPVRAFVLNNVGIRSAATVTVLDNTTGLPLAGATVTLEGQTAASNIKGVANFTHLKLGTATLSLHKAAFATATHPVTINWGDNQLGHFSLNAVGSQYQIVVRDYVSDKPVAGAEATSGLASAVSSQNGTIILTLDNPATATFSVTLSAAGYNQTHLTIPVGSTTPTQAQLVPSGKDYFMSNASGTYNLYSSDLNGQNRQLVLAGTGNETAAITLSISPDGHEAALIDSRDNMRDADGYLLYALTFINLSTNTPLTIEHAEDIHALGWVGTSFIYTDTLAGASAANPNRTHISAYNYATNSRYELAAANQFNSALVANGMVYYATSSTTPNVTAAFYRIQANGTDRQTLLNQEAWIIFRTSYNNLVLQTPQQWYNYTLTSGNLAATTPPSAPINYTFVDNQALTDSLWVDVRDGQGVLLDHHLSSGQDKTLISQSGLTLPARWVTNNLVIYRVSSPTETADYVASTMGGIPKKIADVVDTNGPSNQ